jgi:hypothetical protein
MSEQDLIRSLPPEVRAKYLESAKHMTPGVLRMRFGLDDPMAEEPRVPRTEASRQVAKVASDALKAWQDIHQAHWSSVADPTADKRAAFLRSAQFAKGRLQHISRAHDEALEALTEKAQHLVTVLGNARKPPSGHGDALIDAEVRAMIRAEPNPAKAMQIASAHPRAVASLPAGIGAALVGEEGYTAMVRAHLSSVEPDALADSDDLKAALKQLETATTALDKEARGLIDFDSAAVMEKQGNWKPPAQEAA